MRRVPVPSSLRLPAALAAVVATVLLVAGCGAAPSEGRPRALVIGGIPDQDVSVLQERFDGVAAYLEGELGVPVEYRPSVSYPAIVTAFRNGDVLLGWFGGLTGVQARLLVPGAEAIAQRPIDAEFRSVFVANAGYDADRLADLRGASFTFGSESSTSGHLMPRHFLLEAGIDPERDFAARPSYSGSHDKTWKLVEGGGFDAGVLNETVWERAVAEGLVDTGRVRVVERTPAYFDYHWVAHPRIDELYGDGTVERLRQALLDMAPDDGEDVARTLELFDTDRFVATEAANYAAIERIARDLGMVGE